LRGISTTTLLIRKGQQLFVLIRFLLEIFTHTIHTLGAANVLLSTHTHTHHTTEEEREIRLQILRRVLKEATTRTHTNTKAKRRGKKDVQQQRAKESVFSARGAARNFFATKERRRRASDHGIPEYEYE